MQTFAPRGIAMIGTIIDEESKEDRRKKVVQPWKQEVRDENGRRRLHGAFTGGFSAGYFNTVGSKEGWAPKQFTSSRSKRASAADDDSVASATSAVAQKATDFMDQEDLEQFGLVEGLVAKQEFDMLGGTAAELARRKREQARGGGGTDKSASTLAAAAHTASTSSAATTPASAIPGFAPEQMLGTVSGGVGARLLRTMGWREGQGAGARRQRSRSATAQPTSAGNDDDPDAVLESFAFAPDNVKIIEYDLKRDRRGIGFDPYKNADVVRRARALHRETTGGAGAAIDDDAADSLTQDGRRTRLSLANVLTGREDARSMRGYGDGAFDNETDDADDADIYHQAALDVYDIDETVEQQGHRAAQRERQARRAQRRSGDDDDDDHDDARPLSLATVAADRMLEDTTRDDDDDANVVRCADGRRPVRGFRLAITRVERPKLFALPRVPATFTGRHVFAPTDEKPSDLPTYRRHASAALRARLLSEPSVAPTTAAGAATVAAGIKQSAVLLAAQISSRFVSSGVIASDGTLQTNAPVTTTGDVATTTTTVPAAPTAPVEVTMTRRTSSFIPARLWCKRMNVADPLSVQQRQAVDESALARPGSSLGSAAAAAASEALGVITTAAAVAADVDERERQRREHDDHDRRRREDRDDDRDARFHSGGRQHGSRDERRGGKFEAGGRQVGDVELPPGMTPANVERSGLWQPMSIAPVTSAATTSTTISTTTDASAAAAAVVGDVDVLEKPSIDLFRAIFGAGDDEDDDDNKSMPTTSTTTTTTATTNDESTTTRDEFIRHALPLLPPTSSGATTTNVAQPTPAVATTTVKQLAVAIELAHAMAPPPPVVPNTATATSRRHDEERRRMDLEDERRRRKQQDDDERRQRDDDERRLRRLDDERRRRSQEEDDRRRRDDDDERRRRRTYEVESSTSSAPIARASAGFVHPSRMHLVPGAVDVVAPPPPPPTTTTTTVDVPRVYGPEPPADLRRNDDSDSRSDDEKKKHKHKHKHRHRSHKHK